VLFRSIVRTYALENVYKVFTAQEPYHPGDWKRREVHLSGGGATTELVIWPDDFIAEHGDELISKAQRSILEALRALGKAATSEIHPYFKESKAAFEVFAADLLIDNDGHCWALEVNDKVGYAKHRKWPHYNKIFSDEYLRWLCATVVLPHFGLAERPLPLWEGLSASPGSLTRFSSVLTGDQAVTIRPLSDSSPDQLEELVKIWSLQEVYERIGDGKCGTSKKVDDLYRQAREDVVSSHRDYYHWLILCGGVVVGYIGLIKPKAFKAYDGFKLRYFVHPSWQGRGIATASIALVLESNGALYAPTKVKVWAFIAADNTGSEKAVIKLGFKADAPVTIKGERLNSFFIIQNDDEKLR